jgi:hypothetical protein
VTPRATRTPALAVSALMLLWSQPCAAARTDVLVLRNGDQITGEVSSLERGRLSFKTDDMGTLEIEWSKIAAVTAAAIYEVEDALGRQYVGSLRPGSAARLLDVVGGPAPATDLPMRAVMRIGRVGTSFWGRVTGSVDAGASYAKSNDLLTLDLAATAAFDRPRFSVAAAADATITRQPDAADTQRSSGSVTGTRRFDRGWIATAKGMVEQNRELGYELRVTAQGGAGRYLLRRTRDELIVGAGLGVNREWPVEGDLRVNTEALVIVRYDRYSYDFPHVDITATATGFTSLSDPGRSRFDSDVNLRREVFQDFYLSLRGYVAYDSDPPTAGASSSDYGATFGVGWSF